MKYFILLIGFFVLASCKQPEEKPDDIESEEAVTTTSETDNPAEEILAAVEDAYKNAAFKKGQMVGFDLDLSFNGEERLVGRVTMSTDSQYLRIDKNDGSSILYDGANVFLTPRDADEKGARFDIFTWTYFFALPYKMDDDGTRLSLMQESDEHYALELKFAPETGDAPDDWYHIYVDKNYLIDYVGYIVTYGGKEIETAEENAHAINYTDYTEANGVPYAQRWTFHDYKNMSIEMDQTIGEASISNLEFSELEIGLFIQPADSKKIEL